MRVLRFIGVTLALGVFRLAFLPPLRMAFLRVCGARVGAGTVIHACRFINADRGGFRALSIGHDCFVGDEVLIDLAAPVVLEDQVTVAVRSMLLTHHNVGYHDHPLQSRYPSKAAGVTIRRGSMIGAGATILLGCTVGPEALVGAGSLVTKNVAPGEVVAGVPARAL